VSDFPGGSPGSPPEAGVGRTVIADLKRGGFRRTVGRDLDDLYDFYLDEARRARLRRMHPLRRWISVAAWLLKSLILRLTPTRRILVLISLLLVIQDKVFINAGDEVSLRVMLGPLGYLILFVVLMLELKDKLLARDELAVGRAVQLALLPDRNPELAGWSIWLYTRPANDVGGDLVDYLALPGGRLGLMLGDVAGKGLGAALLMAKLQATLRALAPEAAALDGLGVRLNGIFCRDGLPNRFATLVYLELHPGSGTIHVLNAGHLPPLVLGGSGLVEMEPVAPPLGILPDAEYPEQRLQLAVGDRLVAYSDGVTDARNAAGEMFGDDRLRALLVECRTLGPADLGMRLLADILKFSGEERLPDDLSLIILQRTATAD
jgi:hypothetical protein